MNWIIAIIVMVVIGFILDREIYFYEGTHLGPRLQAWLYDRWSRNYDKGKRLSQLQDAEVLAGPLLNALRDVPEPFILDFATGTGRLSHALLNQAEFKGRIIALDLSLGMLEKAAAKLNRVERSEPVGERSRSVASVEFLRHLALPLPFPDATFDAVCALEVLELFPGMEEPLAELTRVLGPGGILLTSRGTEASGRKAKVKETQAFIRLLESNGLERAQVTKWWKLFDRAIAFKSGTFQPSSQKQLTDVLKCTSCQSIQWSTGFGVWKCQNCDRELTITKEGIVLN